jgi:type I restriction enzyme S subunit
MSKLSEMIARLCPNGVEYKKLGEIVDYEQPGKYIVRDTNYDNSYKTPVLTAGQTFVLGYTNETDNHYMASGEKPVIIFDDFTTAFQWVDFEFKVKSSAMKMLTSRSEEVASLRYIYYAMQCIHYKPVDHSRHWIEKFSNFSIPLPPLPVQREIVQILDNFANLTAELTAELAKRKKQYEHYRDMLFTTLDGAYDSVLKDNVACSFWLMPATPKYVDEGVPYITSKNVRNGVIDFTDVKYITRDDYNAISSSRQVATGDLLITMIGTIGEAAFVGDYTEFYGQNIYVVRFDQRKMIGKYFYYYLTSPRIKDGLISRRNPSSQGYIKAGSITEIQIPLPPLAEQERIVAILDRFDSLCNSLTEGLPAEIALRKKQYEYYRDKLLSFKEAS